MLSRRTDGGVLGDRISFGGGERHCAGFVRVGRVKGVVRELRHVQKCDPRRRSSRKAMEAFRGAYQTVKEIPTWKGKLEFLLYFSKLVLETQIFYLQNIGVGARILGFYLNKGDRTKRSEVSYGKHERQKLVVLHRQETRNAPVVLFIPGGAWGSADLSTYLLLGRTLAEAGTVAMTMTYRTYPFGNVEDMVHDIHEATTWAMQNCGKYGGDKNQLVVFSHSAGAQLSFMDIINRIHAKEPQPAMLLGSCGVYDIGRHYGFEAWRGVSELSTMKPAMGGSKNFDSYSPQHLFQRTEIHQELGRMRIAQKADLEGLIRNLNLTGLTWAERAGLKMNIEQNSTAPLFVLTTSGRDGTVPWHTSAEFFYTLREANAQALFLLYDHVEHHEFMADWMQKNDRDNRLRKFVPESMSGLKVERADERWRDRAEHVRDALKLITHLPQIIAMHRSGLPVRAESFVSNNSKNVQQGQAFKSELEENGRG